MVPVEVVRRQRPLGTGMGRIFSMIRGLSLSLVVGRFDLLQRLVDGLGRPVLDRGPSGVLVVQMVRHGTPSHP